MALATRQQDDRPTRWDPSSDFRRLQSQLSRMLEDWGDMPSLVRDGFVPLADVEETDDAYVIELEVPGIKKGDVDIAVAGRRLTVTGERKEKERAGILRRRTRSVGRFHFEIELPEAIDGNGVSASLGDGVLTVRAPKAVAEPARKVEVK